MVDEQKKEEKKLSMIEAANAAAERLEKANQQQEELIRLTEAVETRKILGGQSTAGVPPPEPKVESPREYAARLLRGEL